MQSYICIQCIRPADVNYIDLWSVLVLALMQAPRLKMSPLLHSSLQTTVDHLQLKQDNSPFELGYLCTNKQTQISLSCQEDHRLGILPVNLL